MAEKQDRVNEGARSFAGARSWRKGGGVGVGGGGVGGRSRVVGLGAGGSGKLRRSFSGSRLFGRRSGLRQAHRGGGQAAKSETAAQGFQYASPVFHNAYDPARLLKALPSLVSGIVRFKKGGIKALGATFETHFAELRGATILLFDAEYSDWAGAATNPPVQGLFNVLGCEITKKAPGDHLVLRKPRDITTIHMDFQGDTSACKEWERYLTAAAKQHRVTLSDFEILKAIGKGASGKVFLVRDKRTGEMLALKSIDKTTLFKSRSAYRHAIDERLMLELSLNEPFFIQLKYAFQTYRKIYFVTEFCEGGDLFYYLKTHGGTLNEAQARRLSAETILALEYMHTHGIVYRDLKPENVLLDHQGHLKLADFGLCKRLEGGRYVVLIHPNRKPHPFPPQKKEAPILPPCSPRDATPVPHGTDAPPILTKTGTAAPPEEVVISSISTAWFAVVVVVVPVVVVSFALCVCAVFIAVQTVFDVVGGVVWCV